MKFILFLLLHIMLLHAGSSFGQNGSIRSSLPELDTYLEKKKNYEEEKIFRIDSLVRQLQKTGLAKGEQYRLCSKLFEEYQLYNYEKAYLYTDKMIALAQEMSDSNRITESRILMAYCCLNAGLFKESNEIAQLIDSTSIDLNHKIFLYSFYAKLNLDMSNSIGVEPYREKYTQESIKYSEAIIGLLGRDKPESLPHWVNIHRCRHEYPEAIKAIQLQLSSTKMNDRSKSLNIGGLGQFYLLMGDTTQAIPYLCYAAVADIKSVIKETPALCMLAGITYSKGDLKHAYTYATEALADANFYNARHRKIEVGSVLPIIEKTRFDIINKQHRRLTIFTILISILFVLFLVSTIVILKQMRQLKQARKINKKQNEELLLINKKLKEADRIKSGYIGYFFSVNSAHIEKLENFQKLLTRKIMSRQFDDLPKLMKMAEIQKEREDMFYTFDQIFIKMFPSFVEQFNLLLKEEYQIKLKTDGVLSPEIRIFGLIRLGISDSESIAKFLNYSINTIHTYKTKIKNRSIVPNEQFEQKIMEIESVKYEPI